MAGSPKFQVNITNSSLESVVIGDGNVVNNYYRRLEYPASCEGSTPSYLSRGITSIEDGGNNRGRSRMKKRQSKIQFPQRKFREDPKRAFEETRDDTASLERPENLQVVPLDAEQKSLSKFFPVLNKLHRLRDGGNLKQFLKDCAILHQVNEGDTELKMLLSIDKALIISYQIGIHQNNLEQAETMVLDALDVLHKMKFNDSNICNYYFLVSMAYTHLTGFYRRQNMYGKAEDSIAIAFQNSTNVNSIFLKALILYEMSSNKTKFISTLPHKAPARDKLGSSAAYYMKQCIGLCMDLDGSHDYMYIKKHEFGLLKLALMELNCRTSAARSQGISAVKCIEEAKNCVKTVEDMYMYKDEMSKAQKIQFLKAKSDLNFRQDNLEEAEMYSMDALHLAESCGFSLVQTGIRERLDDIRSLRSRQAVIPVEISLSSEEHLDTLSSSTSPSKKNSPTSSDHEMEVVQ